MSHKDNQTLQLEAWTEQLEMLERHDTELAESEQAYRRKLAQVLAAREVNERGRSWMRIMIDSANRVAARQAGEAALQADAEAALVADGEAHINMPPAINALLDANDL